MATVSLTDFSATSQWQDLCATTTGLASVDAMIVNVGNSTVYVVSGGAASPVNRSGVPLAPSQDLYVSSDHVWARTLGPDGKLAINTL